MQIIQIYAGKQGRIFIPATLRQQLDIEPGTQIIAWVEDERLILKPKKQLWAAFTKRQKKFQKGLIWLKN